MPFRKHGGDQADHGPDSDAQAADARLALELVRLDGDPVERRRFLSARSSAVVRRVSWLGATALHCGAILSIGEGVTP